MFQLTGYSYFRPKFLTGLGLLQDGGLRANNPTEAGLWEMKTIWPDHPSPSVVLSVGTGFATSPAHHLGSVRSRWFDSFMPRIIRAYLSSPCLHGQNSWNALMNRLPTPNRDSFLRLNVEFTDNEPALDDAQRISELRALAQDAALDIDEYRNRIWASVFFLKVLRAPKYSAGSYHCSLALCNRFSDSRYLLRAILARYPSASFIVNGSIAYELRHALCCVHCGHFYQPLEIDLRRLEDDFEVTLALHKDHKYSISISPISVRQLLTLQNVWFRYGSDTWEITASCECVETPRTGKRRGQTMCRSVRKRRRTTQSRGVL